MLHVEVCGEGPDLVLVHGWGMHGGIWSQWAGQLSQWFRVHCVDLPGHGHSEYRDQRQLRDWSVAVLEVAPAGAWWLGWSLGGLVSLAAAKQDPAHLRGLVLLATTPKFVASAGWAAAVDADVFNLFAQQLDADVEKTLNRFLSLQVRNADGNGDTLRQLRSELRCRPQPDPGALRHGLQLLQTADMRQALGEADLPLFWLLGERDTLVPAGVSTEYREIPSAVIPGAGHAPFLSHAAQCTHFLRRWLLEQDNGVQHAAG
jgi:pimeloyl-[acyl-carrier protein] methyl ester esterase